MTTTPQVRAQGNPRVYVLKPFPPVPVSAPRPAPTVCATPPSQPLPTVVLDPAKPLLNLGLDVHLEFLMAVVQKDHAHPKTPRKFTRAELVAQVARRMQMKLANGASMYKEPVIALARQSAMNPVNMLLGRIKGIQGGLEDCSAGLRQPQS